MSDVAEQAVWLITGCSTGLGREIARQALANQAKVIVTARDIAALSDLTDGFEQNALVAQLDVTDAQQIDFVVQAAIAKFGRIDVLVNNAGYGYQATIEEGIDQEIRDLFDVNVFAVFAVTRAVLPGMREQRSGHIINISSLAGISGFAGSGYYAASKHAVEGFSDSLAAEMRPFGVHVTCIEPGPARTDWAGRSLRQTHSKIADYAETVGRRMKGAAERNGTQPGSPERIAALILEIAAAAAPPRNIALGAEAIALSLRRLHQKIDAIEAWSPQGRATDSGPA